MTDKAFTDPIAEYVSARREREAVADFKKALRFREILRHDNYL